MCLPRIYNYEYIIKNDIKAIFTILKIELDYEHYWNVFPEENVVARERAEYLEFRIFSEMGFGIDNKENYYLLDKGIILPENNTIMEEYFKTFNIFKIWGKKESILF